MNWNLGYFFCFLSMSALVGSLPLNLMFFANLFFDPYSMWDCWARPSTMNECGQVVWLVGSIWLSYRVWPFDGTGGEE